MILKTGLTLFLVISISVANAQTALAPGEQPQITVDARGLIRLVYGEKDKIFFTTKKTEIS